MTGYEIAAIILASCFGVAIIVVGLMLAGFSFEIELERDSEYRDKDEQ